MTYSAKRLSISFYKRDDVVQIAKELLGKKICTRIDGVLTAGIITETEAYCGENDKACHAYAGRFTKRTSTMYKKGGTAYVYLCYGIHHLFNVVTNIDGKADAVLIRAIEPLEGINYMTERRKQKGPITKMTAGPGKLTNALGIGRFMNEEDLVSSSKIWIEKTDLLLTEKDIIIDKRIGIDYAEEDAERMWRFYIKGNKSVSKY
ncbi:DNA-3-methyladenine glycosylase [Marivirga sp. S37H4]|uniref:Putative 3-methyladenine DNA glycosylase n=1 Tax=Marivirga aurantiaca TaxID=2802615 RepID=A0A934WWW3_9BACT|nr:DNA-3-methyladenine glycosylase [Marivirga aurantiaca]MBK6264411.1 DNA-3-methyladenine glycosylase [Marivirga aurantiaca]